MKDRSVEYPNRYRMTLVPGTTDIYEMTPVPGEMYEEGTLMSKANILDDNSEMDIWGTIGDRTPNDAFSFIGKSLTAHDKDIANLAATLEGKIVTGTYTGNGAASRTISLGFKPKMVFLTGIVANYGIPYIAQDSGDNMHFATITPDYPFKFTYSGKTINVAEIVSDGFKVYSGGSIDYSGGAWTSNANDKNKIYSYIAIA